MTLTSSEQKDFFELQIKTRGLSMHRCLNLKTVYCLFSIGVVYKRAAFKPRETTISSILLIR